MFLGDYRKVLPGVDELTREQVSLPVGWWLSKEQREHVARSAERLCGARALDRCLYRLRPALA